MSRHALAAAAEAVCVLQTESKLIGRRQATRFARRFAETRGPQLLGAYSPVFRKERCAASIAHASAFHRRATTTHLHVQARRVIGAGPIVDAATWALDFNPLSRQPRTC